MAWSYIGDYKYPIREIVDRYNGGKNPNSSISDEVALFLREEFVHKDLKTIHEENKDLLSFSGMKKLLYGTTFKNLPVYKKYKKQWILNGTCIDYPRIEE